MYTPLYVKSNYSFFKSLVKIDDLIKKCLEYKITEVALCDDNLIAVMYFYNKCHENNIKPIIGIDLIIDNENILLYAKDFLGYQNILKIVSSNEEITCDLLKKYNKSIICVIPYSSLNIFSKIDNIFSLTYIGVKNKEEEIKALNISKNLVFLNKVLYLNKKEEEYFRYSLMLKDKLNVFDNVTFKDDFNYLLKNDEISVSKKVLDETNVIGSLCNLEIKKNDKIIPKYTNSLNISSEEYLNNLSVTGLKKRLKNEVSDIYKKRLSYELDIINKMGFCDYFLIVYDFVKYAKKSDILVGPGRGSAVGSLVSYSLGITDIDPIKYGLLFERFLNVDRITMPDIDIDFPDIYRDKIKMYVKDKYGEKCVAGILAVSRLKARAAVDDVSKILKISPDKVNRVKRFIKDKDKLIDVYNNNYEFRSILENDDTLKKLYDLSLYFENFPKNITVHASGLVIGENDLDNIIPLIKRDNLYISSFEGQYLEKLGLLKMDFLGNANLTIIMNTRDLIKKYEGKKLDLINIPLDDKDTLNIFYNVLTDGIFQFETESMKSLLRRIKVESFDDLIASVALDRPGPDTNTYVERKNNNIKVDYIDERIEKILSPTYGVLVYQEQVMYIASVMANFTMSEADILRSAMSKKKKDLLESYKEKFITGGLKNGYSYEIVNKYYNDILAFSEYGFNKSHSVAYALVAYMMAYLKVHYPKYFYASILSLSSGDSKNTTIIKEARSRGIKFYLPDINKSNLEYKIVEDGILFPLSSIRNVGSDVANKIINNRIDKFDNIFDCLTKLSEIDIKRNVIENLIYSSSFDSFGYNKRTLIENLDNLLNFAFISKGLPSDLVEYPIINEYPEYDLSFLLEKEKELFGMYLMYHPTSMYKDKYKVINLDELNKYIGKYVDIIVLVDKIKKIKDKKQNDMAFIKGSDELSSVEITVFSKEYSLINEVSSGNILLIRGRVEKRGNIQMVLDKCKILK